jgi:hypothetical protein
MLLDDKLLTGLEDRWRTQSPASFNDFDQVSTTP